MATSAILTPCSFDHEEKCVDLDLYTDFLGVEGEETSHESFTELKEKYEEQVKICQELLMCKERLEEENKILKENMSKLFKTAKQEIYQKNLQLKEMREKLDAIIFRRVAKLGAGLQKKERSAMRKKFLESFDKELEREKCEEQKKEEMEKKTLDKKDFMMERITETRPPVVEMTAESIRLLGYYPTKRKRSKSRENNIERKETERISRVGETRQTLPKNEKIEMENERKNCSRSYDNNDRNRKIEKTTNNKFNIEQRKKRETMNKRNREEGETSSDEDRKRKNRRLEESSTRDRRKNEENDGYLHQLELNRMKMQMRREKTLMDKARESHHQREDRHKTTKNYDYNHHNVDSRKRNGYR